MSGNAEQELEERLDLCDEKIEECGSQVDFHKKELAAAELELQVWIDARDAATETLKDLRGVYDE